MENRFINSYGLINPTSADIISENASLTSIQEYFLSGDENLLENIHNYVEICEESPGLYNQFPIRHNNHDDYMSPDQIIAFVSSLLYKKGGRIEIKNIWEYMVKNLFTYDNLTGEINFKRFMQPSAIFFTGVAAGHSYLWPFLLFIIIYSCITKKGESSGKLKAWTMMRALNMSFMESMCEKILNGFKDWGEVFKTFYREEDHLIRESITYWGYDRE